MQSLIVSKKYDNKKLTSFLLELFPSLSINTIYKALRKKDIRINNVRVNKDVVVHNGDNISVYIIDEILKPKFNLNIVYEDDNILLINKPNNLEVTGENSLTSKVHKLYQDSNFKPMPCHRIDRNTTGLVLFAKNEVALNILLSKFKNHEIEKHYLAWVYGIPSLKSKKLEAFLFKDSKKSCVYISDIPKPGYQKIITSYTIVEKYDDNTCLLEVQIETGRTHQIRAHLAHIGFPIIGDGKYGKNEINKHFGFFTQKLHNYKLKFVFTSDAGILNYLNGKEFLQNFNL